MVATVWPSMAPPDAAPKVMVGMAGFAASNADPVGAGIVGIDEAKAAPKLKADGAGC
jgi:hypothetical protein